MLRAYAVFLDGIKNDLELSQIAFRTAEEVEEENSRKHVMREKKESRSIPRLNKAGHRVRKFVESSSEGENEGEGYEGLSAEEEIAKRKSNLLTNIYFLEFEAAPVLTVSKPKRSDLARYRQYKYEIEKTRSSSLRSLEISTKISILGKFFCKRNTNFTVLFCDILAIYIGSKLMLNVYTRNVELLDLSQESASAIHIIPNYVRQMQLGATNTGPLNVSHPRSAVDAIENDLRRESDAIASMINDNLITEITLDSIKRKISI